MNRDSKEALDHVKLLLESYRRLTGRALLSPQPEEEELLSTLDGLPFVLVSHGTEADPVFNYGNQKALDLFATTWQEFTSLPSRCSAEPPNQEERDRLLKSVREKGYADNYSGVRIAKDGRRFVIDKVTVWNVVDEKGNYHGQAATYSEWRHL